MAKSLLEPMIREAQRRAVIMVIRAHPEWTVRQLFEYMAKRGSHAELLGKLTIRELVAEKVDQPIELAPDGGPPVLRARLEQALRLYGEGFDACVHEVLREAPWPVAASYLRARVGGPRWKLQKSLERLVAAGIVTRTGVTSSTVYRVVT